MIHYCITKEKGFAQGHLRAFTLIELALALAISAVLLCTAQLHMLRAKSQAALQRTASGMVDILDHYALLAQLSGEAVVLRFNRQGGSLWRISATSKEVTSSSSTLAYRLPSGISFQHISFGNADGQKEVIQMRANGTVSPGSLVLSDRLKHSCTIVQALRGARRISCPF